MLTLLITLILYAIILSFAYYILMMLPIPQPFAQWVRILFLLLCLVLLISLFFGHLPTVHIG